MSAKVVELDTIGADPKAHAGEWANAIQSLILEDGAPPRAVLVLVLRRGDVMSMRYRLGAGAGATELVGLLARAQAKTIEAMFAQAELLTDGEPT